MKPIKTLLTILFISLLSSSSWLDVGLDTDIVKSDSLFGMTADVVISSSQQVDANVYSFSEAGVELFEKDYSFERDFRRGWTMHQNKHNG